MSIHALLATGTKIWLDSIDPEQIKKDRSWGITGATSNPIIIADLIQSGRFNDYLSAFMETGHADANVAWDLTNQLVQEAQDVFLPVWQQTRGNDGYVSFELDPLLEDPEAHVGHAERRRRYVELAKEWGLGRQNRMIKVPATGAGLAALEEIAAVGIAINVTLIFTMRQYRLAREAIWRGAQRRASGLERFKSVYSIFVSRVDVYTEKHIPELSPAAQGLVGIVNAKQIWRENQEFWRDKGLPLAQEMIFASTGTKKPSDPPDKYVEALAGSDIQTNPPETNNAVEASQKQYTRQIDRLPPEEVLREIADKVEQQKMEDVLMAEGVKKFVEPQRALLALIGEKRKTIAEAHQ